MKPSTPRPADGEWECYLIQLESVCDNASAALFILDTRQHCTYMNPAAEELTGFSQAEAQGRPLHELVHHSRPDGSLYSPEECPIARATRAAARVRGEEFFVHKDGTFYQIAFTASPIRFDGEVVGTVLEARAIDGEKKAAGELADSELRYRLVANASNDVIWDWDLRTDRVDWNDGVRIRFGYPAEQVGPDGSWWLDQIHPDDRDRVAHGIHEQIEHGPDTWRDEYRFRRADGSFAVVSDRGRVVRDDAGRPVRMVGSMLDLTDRRTAEAALRVSEERFAFVRRSSGVGFWYCDLPFDVLEWDELVKGHFHLPPDARVTIETFYDRIHPDDREPTRRAIERNINGGAPYDVRYRTVAPDGGATKWIRAIGRTFHAPDGSPHRFDGITMDITEEVRAEEERDRLLDQAERARDAAETANRMKDEFLATLSHELRTPLNAIVGWTQILRSGKVDDDDRAEGLEVIHRNARSQAQLIDDLLDISRIMSGKLALEVQRVNLADVIEAALDAVMPAANAKGIKISRVLDGLVGTISGDPTRLQQIVWNLLTNSVKFTARGGKVQVLLERVNSHVEISVVDTGQGIAPEFLPHVFERFRQADGTTTRRHGGLGLGLAIVKQLAEMHGGSVRVKSPGEGQGSTFIVALPITVVHPERPARTPPRPAADPADDSPCEGNDLAGLRVLVVDDEADARLIMRRVLSECGAVVAVAGSVPEALALVESFAPDVLVSDVGMPGQDGYDLIRQVRASRSGKELPAAALTAFARTEDRTRAMRAGFQVHIAKPVDHEELVAVVATLASRTGGDA